MRSRTRRSPASLAVAAAPSTVMASTMVRETGKKGKRARCGWR